MTPKEFDLMCVLISSAARAAYKLGRDDQKSGNKHKEQEFTISLEDRLLIKKEINKLSKKR